MAWQSICDTARIERSISVAREIGERLRNLTLESAVLKVQAKNNRNPSIDYSALAILYKVLYQATGVWSYKLLAQKNFVSAISDKLKTRQLSVSNGLSQLGFVAELLSREETFRHNHFQHSIDLLVASECQAKSQIMLSTPKLVLEPADYDVVSGLCGIIGYLLTRRQQPYLHNTLSDALSCVVSTVLPTKSLSVSPQDVTKHLGSRFGSKDGLIDCGLAHGIPGLLATLSLASIYIKVDGLLESIKLLANWLVGVANQQTFSWAYGVKDSTRHDGVDAMDTFGWCYGAPGVLRSIWLAGTALDDEQLQKFGLEGTQTILVKPEAADTERGTSICHGLAGRLLIAMRFYNETSNETLRLRAIELLDQLISEFRHELPFGYREPDLELNLIDDPGLISGVTGIALVLLAASTENEPVWDRLLMIS